MAALKNAAEQHPKIAAWIGLAIGIVIILLWSTKDLNLLPMDLLALVIAMILFSGFCVWIDCKLYIDGEH